MNEQDIKTALDAIKVNAPERQLLIDYYDGRHPLAFATEKFTTTFGQQLKRLRDNLCPIVVDAPADRMEIINFAGDDVEKGVADAAWNVWQREMMELVSYDTHVEALKTGAAYLIVWGDEASQAKFYLQDSRQCVLIEDEETSNPLFGAKMWRQQDGFTRLTLYYPERIEKYITIKSHKLGTAPELKPIHFREYSSDTEEASTENPYGVIPMFKFETPPVLTNAIPIQDMLNKTVADTMVAMEFAAFRQRWATGLEPPIDQTTGIPTLPFKAGADRLWFTNDKETKFGEFEATDLIPFNSTADKFRLEMALTSGTPVHFFSVSTSDAISGEALKTLESRFTKKVKRLSISFGAVWGKAMKLALQIETRTVPENVTPQWEPAEQKSEKEGLDNAVIKQTLGIPQKTLWEELGYTAEDIAVFEAAAAEKEAQKLKEMEANKPLMAAA